MTQTPEAPGRGLRSALLTRTIALAAALGLACWVQVSGIASPHPPDGIGSFLGALSAVRSRLPGDARVGFAVAAVPGGPGNDMARWYLAQYALAPAIVQTFVLPECLGPEPERCGARAFRFVIVPADPITVLVLQNRLGFSPATSADGFALLERRAP